MTPKQAKKFKETVYAYYEKNARVFPWRKTKNPYHILVSEIMLQQTQTDRVVPKFEAFVREFPAIESLAQASPKKVLKEWQGLGYNRRGLMLHRTTQTISKEHGGIVPRDPYILETLPGIGPYTARAIAVFAYNRPEVVIETNIRTVFIHHFFKDQEKVHDKELLPLIEQALDRTNPKKWYSALMDYGAHLKKTYPNPSRKSVHHAKQPTFKGSDRQIRGEIIRSLTEKDGDEQNLFKKIASNNPNLTSKRFQKILSKLLVEHLVNKKGKILTLN